MMSASPLRMTTLLIVVLTATRFQIVLLEPVDHQSLALLTHLPARRRLPIFLQHVKIGLASPIRQPGFTTQNIYYADHFTQRRCFKRVSFA